MLRRDWHRTSMLFALLAAVFSLGRCDRPPVVASSEPDAGHSGASTDDFYLGGIQVNEPDLGRWVDALAAEGMNTVQVTVYAKQGDWDTDHLWWDEEDLGVLAEIRAPSAAVCGWCSCCGWPWTTPLTATAFSGTA